MLTIPTAIKIKVLLVKETKKVKQSISCCLLQTKRLMDFPFMGIKKYQSQFCKMTQAYRTLQAPMKFS